MPRACSLVLCLGLALAAPATAFADAAARVLSVTPGVRYSLAGAGEALAVKMDVPVKAVVVSDATGKAQLMFPDDSTLSIAPDTHISLAEYVDAEREENIVLDLVSGTARIITGESNRKNPQAFTVNTPQASIGIRGTLVTIQAGGGVTRVYLTETSGQGVSVRNLGTGQVMELRKPGTIINVGANFMEERKAQKEEAASFSAALRGKSRAEIERATARTAGEIHRAAAARLQPEGTLPPAGLADPLQVAALDHADMLSQGTLVADNTPAPQVPDIKPAMPEGPAVPEPILPDPPVQDYVITDFAEIADASFKGKGSCFITYKSDKITGDIISDQDLGFGLPSTPTTSAGNSFNFPIGYLYYPQSYPASNSSGWKILNFKIHEGNFTLNLNGEFSYHRIDSFANGNQVWTMEGKFDSAQKGSLKNFHYSAIYKYSSGNIMNEMTTTLQSPMELIRDK